MTYMIQLPKFGIGSVPVSVAATVYGKDSTWVRRGIIDRWLPIGYATRNRILVPIGEPLDALHGRLNFYISPRKLWEDTGYVWEGDKNGNEHQTGVEGEQ